MSDAWLTKLAMRPTFLYRPALLLWVSMVAMANAEVDPAVAIAGQATECVILLHGLARTPASMTIMVKALQAAGFATVNQAYDSRHHTIEELSALAIPAGLAACRKLGASPIHFVTHSLGGILIRHYLSIGRIEKLARVVMISPPNGGSEVVDALVGVPGFKAINGPAGMQLGTGTDGLPGTLGRADFEVGIITGDRSVNPINSMMIPEADDGKVSVASARLDGMADFLVVHHSHPFIMKASIVIDQTLLFLQQGCFDHHRTGRSAPSCSIASDDRD